MNVKKFIMLQRSRARESAEGKWQKAAHGHLAQLHRSRARESAEGSRSRRTASPPCSLQRSRARESAEGADAEALGPFVVVASTEPRSGERGGGLTRLRETGA